MMSQVKLGYFQAKVEIQKGGLVPLYLIYGENAYLVSDLEHAIRRSLSKDGREVEVFSSSTTTLALAVETAASVSLFGGPRLVACRISGYREMEPFLPAIERYASAPSEDTSLLIHCQSKEPPPSRLEASFGETFRIVSCPKLVGTTLERWIVEEMSRKGLEPDPLVVNMLMGAQGDNPDLHWISGEIEKLCLEAFDPKPEGDQPPRKSVKPHISRGPRTSAFLVTDAIGARDVPGAVTATREALAWGEPPLRLCFMMARHLMLLLRAKVLLGTPGAPPADVFTNGRRAAKGAGTGGKAGRVLGVSPFEEKKITEQARRFDVEEIVTLLDLLLEAESAIKSGLMDAGMALEVFLAKASRVLSGGSGGGLTRGYAGATGLTPTIEGN